ncbi:MAG: SpoIID/LytB domain-containing protein [Candidatus Omnitrophica bacterium]|nr:SpoIID/LytB domain-containing protein [Candidatus Omnitrophota bacterium]MBU4589961.1 SpoIID/LytB domain-containing protein [Candidatus Omnitrophota bacterium]
MIRSTFISILLAVTMFLQPHSLYAMGSQLPRESVPLKVLVVKDSSSVDLSIKGQYRMVDFNSGEVLKEGDDLQKYVVSVENINPEGIKILPEKKARVYINNRQFRGDIDILKDKNGELQVINHIDLEQYLYGVLYHEVSHRWPMEVLKAQAIVARSYAFYQKLVNKSKLFDLSSDVYSQVYGGRTSERRKTTKAVNLTQGLVLTYNGKIFPTYYHATCGGRTSDVTTLWNIDVPALGGKACNFCMMSPHYKWKKELNLSDIEDKIGIAGITSIDIVKRDEAGRILEMSIKGKSGALELSGNKFRLSVGPNIIKSANFEVEIRGRYITFYGKGWGHGIGMCQWGAYGMSRQRWSAEEILDYYYPGAQITRME